MSPKNDLENNSKEGLFRQDKTMIDNEIKGTALNLNSKSRESDNENG